MRGSIHAVSGTDALLSLIMIAALLQSGCATLPQAVRAGNVEAVKEHILAGEDVDPKCCGSESLLTMAVEHGDPEIVRLLISAGAPVNGVNEDWITPLMKAARIGDKEMARLLIDAGANPNSALMIAASRGRADMAQLLIDAGADGGLRVREDTALDLALVRGSNTDPVQQVATAVVLVRGGADGRKAFAIVQQDWILAEALVALLQAAGAPNPDGLVFQGSYDEVAEALTDWTPVPSPREKKPPLIVRIIGGVVAIGVAIILTGLGVESPEP
jgi:hypothetical protein